MSSLIKDKKYSIDELFKAGVISAKAHAYVDISDKVKSLIKASNISQSVAIKTVAYNLNIHISTVYRSVNLVSQL